MKKSSFLVPVPFCEAQSDAQFCSISEAMEPIMVVKVKYGEMLRRFNVRVLENNKLDLDFHGLKAKILDLFNFSNDTDVTLTYIDEDGDAVTLLNDDDLHDVLRQRLKFLRIDVHLRNESLNVGTGVSEVMKSLPEPLLELCSQFLIDIASKAAVTSTQNEGTGSSVPSGLASKDHI